MHIRIVYFRRALGVFIFKIQMQSSALLAWESELVSPSNESVPGRWPSFATLSWG